MMDANEAAATLVRRGRALESSRPVNAGRLCQQSLDPAYWPQPWFGCLGAVGVAQAEKAKAASRTAASERRRRIMRNLTGEVSRREWLLASYGRMYQRKCAFCDSNRHFYDTSQPLCTSSPFYRRPCCPTCASSSIVSTPFTRPTTGQLSTRSSSSDRSRSLCSTRLAHEETTSHTSSRSCTVIRGCQ